ncbi:MAG TPA: hypothetical protein VFJ61_02965 [Solirubrobacterales bacterium]|nr:hypothetical protein [Solirubrobacterales bacterium]
MIRFLLAVAAAALLLAPAAPAGAATVVNGDFESGTLGGWTVVNVPAAEPTGDWYAYTGTTPPIPSPPTVPPPPAGSFAAITAQGEQGTHVLYQDVALEASDTHQLSLIAYYDSPSSPPETPQPNSLRLEGVLDPPNQQYRIDVIKPSASIYSLAPGDVLATVFATKTGDPKEMGPTTYTADLTPFAGQTVRLRLAEVDNQGELYAGVDNVAIKSALPPTGETPSPSPTSTPSPSPPLPLSPPAPANAFSFGKPTLNKKSGTAKLPVALPGPGTVRLVDVKTKKKQVQTKTLQSTAAGTVQLPIKPTKAGRETLLAEGKLLIRVAVTFTPSGGSSATQTRGLTLKLAPK